MATHWPSRRVSSARMRLFWLVPEAVDGWVVMGEWEKRFFHRQGAKDAKEEKADGVSEFLVLGLGALGVLAVARWIIEMGLEGEAGVEQGAAGLAVEGGFTDRLA